MELVIGGSGFIGCRLVEILKRNRQRVRVFDINPYPVDESVQPDEMMVGTVLDLNALMAALKDCHNVYHLAANPMLWHPQSGIFDQVNRKGTENVVTAVNRADVRRLVYTSTESILVPPNHKGPVNEDVRTSLADMIGPYCRSKFLAERCVLKLAKSGFPAVIVNPTMPIGPCDRNLTPPGQMIRNFLLGKIKGYMDGSLNIVDVRDVAAGHFLAMQKGISGRRYILGGTNLSVKDFFDRLAALSGCPAPRFKIPYFMALAFAYIEEAYAGLTGRRPLSSVTGIRLLRRSLIFDSTRTWRQLDHTCYSVDDTLKNSVFWHRQKLIEEGTTI